ncbi:hypothetical protein L9F63_022274, partial [Diploptera punctata]
PSKLWPAGHIQPAMAFLMACVAPQKPLTDDAPVVDITGVKLSSPPSYKPGESVATRLAYGTALAKIAANNSRVIALDGDTKNSTYSDRLKKAFPDRYIECFIAEQNLVGVAIGATCRNRTIAFIRMGAISQTNVNFVGSHCGVSIGEDGPSQMGLEDIAMFRSIPGCTVFYPSDAVSTERAVELAANTKGICFIRTSRPNTAILYKNDEVMQIGKAKIVKKSAKDQVLVIGAGVTLHEALTAATELAKAGIHIRVMDPFTVKPIDTEAIISNAKECGGKILTVEDHYPQGGVGEAVLSAVALEKNIIVKKLAVQEVPRSGPPTVLLEKYGISAKNVVKAVQELVKEIAYWTWNVGWRLLNDEKISNYNNNFCENCCCCCPLQICWHEHKLNETGACMQCDGIRQQRSLFCYYFMPLTSRPMSSVTNNNLLLWRIYTVGITPHPVAAVGLVCCFENLINMQYELTIQRHDYVLR